MIEPFNRFQMSAGMLVGNVSGNLIYTFGGTLASMASRRIVQTIPSSEVLGLMDFAPKTGHRRGMDAQEPCNVGKYPAFGMYVEMLGGVSFVL